MLSSSLFPMPVLFLLETADATSCRWRCRSANMLCPLRQAVPPITPKDDEVTGTSIFIMQLPQCSGFIDLSQLNAGIQTTLHDIGTKQAQDSEVCRPPAISSFSLVWANYVSASYLGLSVFFSGLSQSAAADWRRSAGCGS